VEVVVRAERVEVEVQAVVERRKGRKVETTFPVPVARSRNLTVSNEKRALVQLPYISHHAAHLRTDVISQSSYNGIAPRPRHLSLSATKGTKQHFNNIVHHR
jgi:hypothetical protein